MNEVNLFKTMHTKINRGGVLCYKFGVDIVSI